MNGGNICGTKERSRQYFPEKCGDCGNLFLEKDSAFPFPYILHCGKYGQQRPDMSGGKDIINYVSKIPEYVEKLSEVARGETI